MKLRGFDVLFGRPRGLLFAMAVVLLAWPVVQMLLVQTLEFSSWRLGDGCDWRFAAVGPSGAVHGDDGGGAARGGDHPCSALRRWGHGGCC
ncbi:MAG: hypothetical protein K0V04_00220 [Deltaproteobacteria bacterium]|nr:hypothetical protein [Deltaproteobacteria bacterium]